jgi:hypothetical protein
MANDSAFEISSDHNMNKLKLALEEQELGKEGSRHGTTHHHDGENEMKEIDGSNRCRSGSRCDKLDVPHLDFQLPVRIAH